MKRTALPPRFRRLLHAIPYVTIATVCPSGTPWNTPVVGYFDDDLNLYWASWPRNQHSRNIAQKASIFVVVYDSRTPLNTGQGLFLQMEARKLTRQSEIEAAKTIYRDRYGEDDCTTVFAGSCPRRIYQATPQNIWYNTDGECGAHFIDIRQLIAENI